MNTNRAKKIIRRIVELETDIAELKKARMNIGLSEYASVTLASSGGSKSFSRLTIDQLTKLIEELSRELSQLRNYLATGSTVPLRSIITYYC